MSVLMLGYWMVLVTLLLMFLNRVMLISLLRRRVGGLDFSLVGEGLGKLTRGSVSLGWFVTVGGSFECPRVRTSFGWSVVLFVNDHFCECVVVGVIGIVCTCCSTVIPSVTVRVGVYVVLVRWFDVIWDVGMTSVVYLVVAVVILAASDRCAVCVDVE